MRNSLALAGVFGTISGVEEAALDGDKRIVEISATY